MVNGKPITRDALARFTGAMARERGRLDLDPAEQRRILDRLIDEELLLQHGIALGLDRSEPSARRAIVSAVVDTLTTAEMRDPDAQRTRGVLSRLRQDASRARGRAGRSSRSCRSARSPRSEAKRRAGEIARRARAGESLAALAASSAPLDPPLPPGPTNFDALRDRFGERRRAGARAPRARRDQRSGARDGRLLGGAAGRARTRRRAAARRRRRRGAAGVDPARARRASHPRDRTLREQAA